MIRAVVMAIPKTKQATTIIRISRSLLRFFPRLLPLLVDPVYKLEYYLINKVYLKILKLHNHS